MSNKAGPNNGPHPHSQEAASPSRRRLLQGLGLSALALGGSRPVQAADKAAEPLAAPQDERWQKQPFYAAIRPGC